MLLITGTTGRREVHRLVMTGASSSVRRVSCCRRKSVMIGRPAGTDLRKKPRRALLAGALL